MTRCLGLRRPAAFTAGVAAVVVVVLALSASTASAKLPKNKPFHVPKSILGPEFNRPDPTKVKAGLSPTKKPGNAYEVVHRCWGYLGNNQAVGWVKMFFINGTLPSANVCHGVLNLHRDCWTDMFNVWWFVDDRRIGHLHNHCVKTLSIASGSP
ncbi:hypothetical protein KSP40_PGU018090 [Platanthera guangdongensis]|uniref:Prolamin-like domain-containing protein n=1 Tax=Platanthera guangdongensis TaxID=2320717 RepID=A0ABR2M291_9ASPA